MHVSPTIEERASISNAPDRARTDAYVDKAKN